MKKFTLITLSFLLCSLFVYSNTWQGISTQSNTPAEISLLSTDQNASKVLFQIPGFEFIEVETEQGKANVLKLEDASYLLQEGAPDVLKLTASLHIPDQAGMGVRVVSSEYTDYEDILIAPSKGNLTRDINPEDVPYVYGDEYTQDAFFPGELVELRDPYIMRDYRGQTIVAYPFQYNPISKTLRVYHTMEVEIFKINDNGVNPLLRDREITSVSSEYSWLYERHFLNPPSMLSDYTPVNEHGNMLIISYANFMTAMQPLIDWRIQTGTPVEMVDVATIGGSAQIKNYIANYYNTTGLTFVLLVGDAEQVPSSFSSGDSDNDYAYIVGSDHYPDVFIGRFSAENVDHVETQVSRTLTYEQNPDQNLDWFTRGIGIASAEGPGDDGEYDYQHIRNLQDDLIDFTYTFCAELFDGSQGGNDATGNPTPSMVAAEVNTGATIINYTGHGSDNAWSSSGFSSNDVNNLTNTTMWPFIWAVACVNGNFVGQGCFAEAWLRATDNGEPAGAVATMMSTINQSWNPPMCAQDEMVDVLVETYSSNINRTFGAASMHGCMLMNDEYGAQGDEMTDTWVCFGDPSLHMRTAVPQTMTASYMPTLFIGMNSLQITCDAEGGTACLTKEGTILASDFISGGEVILNFDVLNDPCEITLTITAFNYLPHIAQIDVIPGNAPFLAFDDDHVVDLLGNNNGNLDFGESVTYTIDLFNLGAVDAVDVEVTLSTNDPYVTITDDYELYTLIPAGQVVGVDEGFAMEIADDVPDEHIIDFTVTATNSDTSWIMEYQNSAFAPILNIAEMIIDDQTTGNGNGRMDPGETVILKVKNFNTGHCPAENCEGVLTSSSQYLDFTSNTYSLTTLGLLGSRWSEFEVEVDPDAPDGAAIATFDYELISGSFIETAQFSKKIGLIYEDWETGDFTKFDWEMSGDQPWQIRNIYPYEGTYAAKSGNIGDDQQSILEIDVEVMIADSVTFAFKTSSQTNKDKLKFYINNTLQGEWSGMNSSWFRVAIPVETGVYTFKWVYEKDASGMFGSDCAWIDWITFPPLMTLTCYAGPDATTCDGDSYQCLGEATDWVGLEWTTNGDGNFDDPTILNPIYYPGTDDLNNGYAALTITAENADGETVDDEMTLMLIEAPETPAKPQGPDYVNLNNVISSEYTAEAVPYTDYYEWHVEPIEAGDFMGMGPTGTINWNMSFLGTATVTVKAFNSCGESEYSEGFEVTVDNVTSVSENETLNTFSLWPNPNSGNFTIEISASEAGQYSVIAYNMIGKLMAQQDGIFIDGDASFNLDFGHLPEGLYFVVVRAQDVTMIQKLIIHK